MVSVVKTDVQGKSPVCGDSFKLYVRVCGDALAFRNGVEGAVRRQQVVVEIRAGTDVVTGTPTHEPSAVTRPRVQITLREILSVASGGFVCLHVAWWVGVPRLGQAFDEVAPLNKIIPSTGHSGLTGNTEGHTGQTLNFWLIQLTTEAIAQIAVGVAAT